jgi:hypothetical protein
VAFRDVTPERMRGPLSVLVANWRKIPITLVDLRLGHPNVVLFGGRVETSTVGSLLTHSSSASARHASAKSQSAWPHSTCARLLQCAPRR